MCAQLSKIVVIFPLYAIYLGTFCLKRLLVCICLLLATNFFKMSAARELWRVLLLWGSTHRLGIDGFQLHMWKVLNASWLPLEVARL